MRVPKLRFPEFRDAGEWEEKKIGQISENVTAGGTPSTSEKEYWGGSIRWMNSGELNFKKVHEVQGRITEEGLRNSSTKIIPRMCVLIGLAGQGKTRGTVAINMVELCINQSIAAIFPNEESFFSDFLYHNLNNRYDELRSLSAGGEGRGGLNLQIIKSLGISLPRLKEQQKIADCLSSLDELITAQAQKLDTLKAYKKGLMQKLFPAEGETVPKLRFPEFREAGEWEEKPLEQAVNYENGKAHENHIAETGKYIVVNSKFISTEGEIRKYSDNGLCLAEAEDVFMVLSDVPNGKAIAKCYFVESDNLYTVNQRICKLKPKNIIGKLLFYILDRNPFYLAFDDGVKQTNLRKEDVLGCPIILPSPPEQQKIADCLSSLDEIIAAQAQKLGTLKAHKKGLMQQLFPSVDEVNG